MANSLKEKNPCSQKRQVRIRIGTRRAVTHALLNFPFAKEDIILFLACAVHHAKFGLLFGNRPYRAGKKGENHNCRKYEKRRRLSHITSGSIQEFQHTLCEKPKPRLE